MTDRGEVPVDVYQKLSEDRILFVCNNLTDQLATDIVATLLLKDAEDPTRKITLFINSNGGDIRNAFMVCDMMRIIEAPIETVCIGAAMNEAALILASGEPGQRFATKNAVVGISQLHHDYFSVGDLTDAKKLFHLSASDNKRMIEMLAKSTKKTVKQITNDVERQVFLTAPQAAKYGLIDKVVTIKK